jgi:hypothetical protein
VIVILCINHFNVVKMQETDPTANGQIFTEATVNSCKPLSGEYRVGISKAKVKIGYGRINGLAPNS